MAITIEQLTELAQNLEDRIGELHDIECTKDEISALDALATRLAGAATMIAKKTESLPPSKESLGANGKLIIQAGSSIKELLQTRKLKNPAVFRRTVALLFSGPKKPDLEDLETRTRKAKRTTTHRRCEKLRKLDCDGLITWAVSFAPTIWSANSMTHAVFDSLVDEIQLDIELRGRLSWPPTITDNLTALQDHMNLKNSLEYSEFLSEALIPSDRSNEAGTRMSQLYDPGHENREMKHMFTNAPASDISRMPEPFRTAIRNGKNWKWERNQGYSTTSSWSTLFPKDNSQDVSFTLWVGHNDGYALNDRYGLNLAVSS